MHTFYRFCFMLRKLTWQLRLLLILITYAIPETIVVYLVLHHQDQSIASLLIFSGILAALCFSWKYALAIEWSLLLVYIGIDFLLEGPNSVQIVAFLEGTSLDFFIIGTIGMLRHAWDVAEKNAEHERKLNESKDQFVANVNHELRTPLAGAIGSLDLIYENGKDLEPDEQKMFLEHAIYGCTEIQRLVDNILDAVRSEEDMSQPVIRDFDLCTTCACVMRHQDMANHPLVINMDIEPITVFGDSQYVSQVLRNLLSNCCKYTPGSSNVTVGIWKDDAYGYVSVKDTGPGIAPEDIPTIFQKFGRATRDVGGTIRGIGLGLYICRRVIEAMGGSISVESEVGVGSNFRFMLPRAHTELMDTEKIRCPLLQKRP